MWAYSLRFYCDIFISVVYDIFLLLKYVNESSIYMHLLFIIHVKCTYTEFVENTRYSNQPSREFCVYMNANL